jgi:endogenous inhibitor of DNA gyrase (YacG/DUF329 family)
MLDDDTNIPIRHYRCTICGREVPYAGPTPDVYPFCSPRCKWVDLGKWFREDYTVDRDLTPDDIPGDLRPPGG